MRRNVVKVILLELKNCITDQINILCDNQVVISIAKNLVHHDQTKHVDIDRHFIKEKFEDSSINISYIPTAF